jgi:hypothetical protein
MPPEAKDVPSLMKALAQRPRDRCKKQSRSRPVGKKKPVK